ncbi:hypothetical protein B566_EDAN019159 [Ephemera danica]|nr:hypothetical protein B566_EDAN019159 [Ephemera danica]
MAQLVDEAGVDVILVGDSASNVMAGNQTTLPITLDQMIYHGKSVVNAVQRALVVVDLPFGTYQGNSKKALSSAIRIMKETAADAVKLEGGSEVIDSVERILSAGIPKQQVQPSEFGLNAKGSRLSAPSKTIIFSAPSKINLIGCLNRLSVSINTCLHEPHGCVGPASNFPRFLAVRNACVVGNSGNPCRKFRFAPKFPYLRIHFHKHLLANIFHNLVPLHNAPHHVQNKPLVFGHQKPEGIAVAIQNLLH